ncbi:GNAT family N-acetyltransferase [Isobaculum melis]|uniref:Protein N-acetyltransferase, RimJ/RimL family n=1 Tax=Isobaculum melis TaxID=142588 RepID=A0A1H9TG95_9LACT|nr:GNAT family protein [Isobaculum melis]SER96171.1 Protein N-acetyltransferase, RimJ/RimL family [Isobaculum melis]
MTEEITVELREVIPEDAVDILALLKQVGQETDYLLLGTEQQVLTVAQEKEYLQNRIDLPNNLMLVAIAGNKIIGLASVTADTNKKIQHVGEIGISILKDYWGFGVGSLLLDELIYWSQTTGLIRRLELTVQERNQRAVRLYEKFGFQTEGLMERGICLNGDFHSVRLMSLLIDG